MKPLRIVVADDDCHIRDLVTDILEEAGYTVEAYGDGQSALAAICVNPPAVALFDVMMPVMTGDEALREIQQADLSVPVVMMTAGTQPQRFLQQGAVAVLPKPFELTVLLRVIAQVRTPVYMQEQALGDNQDRRPYASG